jgi:hypothetical protein
MSVNDLPSASLSEQELTQQVAELEERLRRLSEPSSSLESRRRALLRDPRQGPPAAARGIAPVYRHEGKVDRRELPRIAVDVPGQMEGPDGERARYGWETRPAGAPGSSHAFEVSSNFRP